MLSENVKHGNHIIKLKTDYSIFKQTGPFFMGNGSHQYDFDTETKFMLKAN